MRYLFCSLAAVALLAACGGGGTPGPPAGAITVKLTDYKFGPSELTAPAGKVVFYLVNSGTTAHDMAIRDTSKKQLALSEVVAPGDSKVFTVDNIAAGSYVIFCSQTGHEANGMIGKLTVT
jgi:plastocyanin